MIVKLPAPVLVSVAVFVALVVPSGWFPKLSDVGLNAALAALVEAVVEPASCETTKVVPPTDRLPLRAAPVLTATE